MAQSTRPHQRTHVSSATESPVASARSSCPCCLWGCSSIAVFPTRSYLAQRASVHQAEQRLNELNRENRRLAAQTRRLTTPAEIERLARGRTGSSGPASRHTRPARTEAADRTAGTVAVRRVRASAAYQLTISADAKTALAVT